MLKQTRNLLIVGVLAALVASCGGRAANLISAPGIAETSILEPMEIIGFRPTATIGRIGPLTRRPLQSGMIRVPRGTEFVVPVIEGIKLFTGDQPGGDGDRSFGFVAATLGNHEWTPNATEELHPTRFGFDTDFGTDDWDQTTGVETRVSYLFLRRAQGATIPGRPTQRLFITSEDSGIVQRGEVPNGNNPLQVAVPLRDPGGGTNAWVTPLQGFSIGYGSAGDSATPADYLPERPDDQNVNLLEVAGDNVVTPREILATAHLRDDDGIEPWFASARIGAMLMVATDYDTPLSDTTIEPAREIVGLVQRFMRFNTRPDSPQDETRPGFFQRSFSVLVPEETDLVVPVINNVLVGYGSITALESGGVVLSRDTHQLGTMQVDVQQLSVRPVTGIDRKLATFLVTLGLRDQDADDEWFGQVGMTLLLMRRLRD